MQATIGFRVKSGWAAAVLLAGPAALPRVLVHRPVELSDPAVPASRQPYHAGIGIARIETATFQRLIEEVRRYAGQSIAEWIGECRAAGYQLGGAGLVVGSEVDPNRIASPHIRAHAAEGRLFRSVVEDAIRSSELACTTFVERDVFAQAATILGRSETSVKQDVSQLGRTVNRPWRQEQKVAATAAWMVLASLAG